MPNTGEKQRTRIAQKICINGAALEITKPDPTMNCCLLIPSTTTEKNAAHTATTNDSNFVFPSHSFCWLNIILFLCLLLNSKKIINKFSLFGQNYFLFSPSSRSVSSSLFWRASIELDSVRFIFALLASGMNVINFSIHTYLIQIACIHAVFIFRQQDVSVRQRRQIDRNW